MSSSNRDKIMAMTICSDYIESFPDNKIWITRKFGKRDSYLAGLGQEKYCKAVRVKLSDDYTAFVEDKWEMKDDEISVIKEYLEELFERHHLEEGAEL